MQNQLFRQKSLDRISSPEEMHDYMRVTSPRLWMILAAIVVLLGGFIAYAATTTMESTMPIKVTVEVFESVNEETGKPEKSIMAYTQVLTSQKDTVTTGKTIRIGENVTGKISYIGTSKDADAMSVFIEFDQENPPLKDGEYDAVLVLDAKTPISFLWND